LRRHQEDFEKKRNAEILEVQRMEAAEKRRSDEMARRIAQQAAQREQDFSTMKKIVSRSIAVSHLNDLKSRAMAHLHDAGVFADTVKGAVEMAFVPQLFQMAAQQMQQNAEDRANASAIMRSLVNGKFDAQAEAIAKERRRLAIIDEAEKKVRIEAEQARLRKEAERQRIEIEQKAMIEWELWQPPPPPQVTIASLTEDETPQAVLTDERQLPLPAEKLEELKGLLESVAADATKIVVASQLEDPDAYDEASATFGQYVDDFKVIDAPEPAAAETEAAGEGEAA
jgi:hypothetical protein